MGGNSDAVLLLLLFGSDGFLDSWQIIVPIMFSTKEINWGLNHLDWKLLTSVEGFFGEGLGVVVKM